MTTFYTNKHDLPDNIVRATMNDKYVSRGDISVTSLIDAPKIRYLKKRHDIEVDVMDMFWALTGTAVHHIVELGEQDTHYSRCLVETAAIIEETGDVDLANSIRLFEKKEFSGKNPIVKAKMDNVLLEKQLSMNILGWELTGTPDKFQIDVGKIEDYKYCSVYQYMHPEGRKKWMAQLNIYAHMLRDLGYEVKELEIIAMFRDWKSFGVSGSKDYPKTPIVRIPVKLHDDSKVRDAIKARLKLHIEAEHDNVKPCNDEERWATSDTYAVMRKGKKSALRVCQNERAAELYVDKNEYKHATPLIIEFRPGESKRCKDYCAVNSVCKQWKAIKRIKAENLEDKKKR